MQLMGTFHAGNAMSSAVKGREREWFVSEFLGQAFPPPYRIGSGDIIDKTGTKSGQTDIVVEFPLMPSLPNGLARERLYMAEAVAAVIEVKSNLANQWDEVNCTAGALAKVKRAYKQPISRPCSYKIGEQIPLFVVGYTGWTTVDTARNHLSDQVQAILVIENGIFVCSESFGKLEGHGPWALWGLLCCIHLATWALESADASPYHYLPVVGPEREMIEIKAAGGTAASEVIDFHNFSGGSKP